MNQRDLVVLVDEKGAGLVNAGGELLKMEKMEAHRRGLKHSAVSVFVFNDRGELLLQRRAEIKYHSPGKWSNTCCTHPLPGETPADAARRRLMEEMGLKVPLKEAFAFSYEVDLDHDMKENEFDHVFFGISNQTPVPDPAEVRGWKWIKMDELQRELSKNPEEYSAWLRVCFDEVGKRRQKQA